MVALGVGDQNNTLWFAEWVLGAFRSIAEWCVSGECRNQFNLNHLEMKIQIAPFCCPKNGDNSEIVKELGGMPGFSGIL